MEKNPRLIVALDYPDAGSALRLVERMDPHGCAVKVGLQLFVAAGPDLVDRLQRMGFRVFLDLKFHDIPHTVQQACQSAARLGVWMLTVHASGGSAMIQAAREGLDKAGSDSHLLAVTVLTSSHAGVLAETGIPGGVQTQVLRLGQMAVIAGASGLVCSAHEAADLRRGFGSQPLLVTPGIRLADIKQAVAGDDQQRIMTPTAALHAGASHLVIGRPITAAPYPEKVLQDILASLPESRESSGLGHP